MPPQSRLSFVDDLSLAAWLEPRLDPRLGRVGSVVPKRFPAYARVLHPAADAAGEPLTWSQVCERTDRAPHALMQWEAISSPRVPDGSYRAPSRGLPWDGHEPSEGDLEPRALSALCEVLSAHTAPGTPCVLALWEGYGWIRGGSATGVLTWPPRRVTTAPPAFDEDVLAGPRLELPGRRYLLFTGPLESALELGHRPTPDWFVPQSPNLFWPVDRSWCVGTDIDLTSTVVGGDADLVDEVLADPRLDAWPVEAADDVSLPGDTVNV